MSASKGGKGKRNVNKDSKEVVRERDGEPER